MARVRLRQSETRGDRLPMVCMVCGRRAASHIHKNFRWYPEWVGVLILAGVLPFWIMAAVLSQYMLVDVPVCERHTRYFVKRGLALAIVVAVIFLIPIAIAVIGTMVATERGDEALGITAGFSSFGVCVFVGIIVIYFIQNGTLRPKQITDRTITLVRVHEDFVEAVERRREMEDLEDRPLRRAEVQEVLPAEPADARETFRERPGGYKAPRRGPD
jgi:hypothetical protein